MFFEDTYKTIEKISKGLYKAKGSKFISYALPCETEAQVKSEIEVLKKKYYDARHHCYAYILGFDKSAFRTNDDGEPSGTAGKPIYGQLLSHDLTNTLIVVIRYFGGIKLGIRGLINAYKYAALDAIDNGRIITKIVKDVYEVKFDYADMNDVMHILKEDELEQLANDFRMKCSIRFAVRRKNSEKVYKRFASLRKVNINFLNSTQN